MCWDSITLGFLTVVMVTFGSGVSSSQREVLLGLLTAYSARGQLMCHEDASPDANLMKTVLVLLGYLIPQHNFCKRNFRTPAWVNNVISLHGS
jgi:hypothetical protein